MVSMLGISSMIRCNIPSATGVIDWSGMVGHPLGSPNSLPEEGEVSGIPKVCPGVNPVPPPPPVVMPKASFMSEKRFGVDIVASISACGAPEFCCVHIGLGLKDVFPDAPVTLCRCWSDAVLEFGVGLFDSPSVFGDTDVSLAAAPLPLRWST